MQSALPRTGLRGAHGPWKQARDCSGLPGIAGKEIIDEAATCTKDGAKHTTCVDCGARVSSSIVKATGHRVDAWESISKENCAADGVRTGVCTVCQRECFDLVPAWGHQFTEWIENPTDYWAKNCEIVIPTCTTDGYEYRYCITCHIIESRFVKAHGHTPGEWQVKENATCTQTGIQEQFCADCEVLLTTSIIPVAKHTPNEWVATVDPTCCSDGKKEQRCSVCEELLELQTVPMMEHTPGEWATIIDPTCYSMGRKEQSCSDCGSLLEWQTIPMTDHFFVEIPELTVAPSCTAEGEKTYKCAESDCYATKREILDKIAHTLIEHERREADCEMTGYIVKKCVEQGCGYSTVEEIAELGHDYDDGIVVRDEGSVRYTCQRGGCGNTYVETISEIEISISVERNETVSGVVDVLHMKEYRISASGGYGDKAYLAELYNGDMLVETFSNATGDLISFAYRMGKNETDLYRLIITVEDEIGNRAEKTINLSGEN